MRKTTYKKAAIHYTVKGTGNPLVLLHGFLESKEIWTDFAEELSLKRQVVCIDLPGHGDSGSFGSIHSMGEMAEAVKTVLDELNIKKVALAGHSMGGYVGLELCYKFPMLLNALVLVNSTPFADDDKRKINRDRAANFVLRNKNAFVKMAIANLMTRENYKRFKPQLEVIKLRALNIPKTGIYAAIKGMKVRKDHLELFANFEHQKIIVAGINDPIVDYNTIKLISKRCGSEFKSLPDGHLSFLENKKELLEILQFID
ncbi:Pimeloyl-ACP methyl ester carboxylesterase [Salegentibacter echinorum]|uniref:Pimeloyl-ACP methyl ester carboxylesterase n=1 Tax=Salegentibacter echinorum TaxID=1073325 RepID=A0A1M5EK15_SALEC|nr:alpha/beta hydrolase [Salegentibacter echinorum]SHF79537.1 Pimeloyl-ACP methyl ester carboxylesterase [Salegentibacter echinorum]